MHALLFIELDNLKSLNDTLGHQSGDRLLSEVAQRMTIKPCCPGGAAALF
jgi:diguanylate cyclase (GGDEF)-like protein